MRLLDKHCEYIFTNRRNSNNAEVWHSWASKRAKPEQFRPNKSLSVVDKII